jgi:hypothetical protein
LAEPGACAFPPEAHPPRRALRPRANAGPLLQLHVRRVCVPDGGKLPRHRLQTLR